MIRVIKSELYKMKGTWILWIHLIIPIVYAFLFYAATQVTSLKNFAAEDIIKNYLIILGSALPIVVGILTSKIVDMEKDAGNFQLFLSSISRSTAYIGKLFVLFIGALCSITLSVSIFNALYNLQNLSDCLLEILAIAVGAFPVYIIHLWVSTLFGSGASLGLGFAESLMALLSQTVLFEKIWYYLPCTWSSRLVGMYVVTENLSNHSYLYEQLRCWCFVAIPIIFILLVSSNAWFKKWDGKSIND